MYASEIKIDFRQGASTVNTKSVFSKLLGFGEKHKKQSDVSNFEER